MEKSKKRKTLSKFPEMDYFMNESLSDVVFIIEGERLPARKELLIIKNKVFRAMFSENFKESKDKEVEIKDTTFEAFKTLIWFLYCDQLALKDEEDYELIEEVYKLSDRYEATRLMDKISDHLKGFELTFLNFESVLKIAFTFKNKDLMSKVMTFIGYKFDDFVNKDFNELIEFNDSTDSRLFKVVVLKYRKLHEKFNKMKDRLNQIEKSICKDCAPFTKIQSPPIPLLNCIRCQRNFNDNPGLPDIFNTLASSSGLI